jgi:hypothetical protein
METLKENLEKDIRALARPLLEDIDKLVEVLRRRLTKKEWKYYKCKIEGSTSTEMCAELNCDNERLQKVIEQTLLKLNQEKIKQELMT